MFTEAVEKRLPEGAMIFEEPIMDYPEQMTSTVTSYEHFRPYLFSQTLRFSFGGEKGRPLADWQHQLDGLPLPDLVAAPPALRLLGDDHQYAGIREWRRHQLGTR